MKKILVVEDEASIRDLISINLQLVGYEVFTAEDGIIAEKFLENQKVDLILLDVMIPGIDGFSLIEKIKKHNTPVIFVTAKESVLDRVKGLRLGAEDYIIKPFSNMELIARIKALIRRREIYDQKHMDEKLMNESVECCGVKVYINQNKVEVDGKSVKLTRKEYEILKLLIRYPDKVFTTENIYESVWGDMYTSISGNTIMVHVKNLRSKLSKVCGDIVIATVWGRGYKFER